jgi:hypothetical protein
MKAYRRHTFPPLVQLLPGVHDAPGIAAADSALTEEVLEEYRKEGYEQGRASGYAEGYTLGGETARREALAALDALSQPFEALIAGVNQLRSESDMSAREQIASLVEQVARWWNCCVHTIRTSSRRLKAVSTISAFLPIRVRKPSRRFRKTCPTNCGLLRSKVPIRRCSNPIKAS